MTLNHLNITVTDVNAAVAFLETFFDLKKIGGNAGMSFLQDDKGFVLSVMRAGRNIQVEYPANFHIGFFVESRTKVDSIHAKLRSEGFAVADPEERHAYNFYVEAPGGFTVECGA